MWTSDLFFLRGWLLVKAIKLNKNRWTVRTQDSQDSQDSKDSEDSQDSQHSQDSQDNQDDLVGFEPTTFRYTGDCLSTLPPGIDLSVVKLQVF